ncbi:hypothetical protein [Planctomyces sp. SH-PL14]|uniref:hypothetical protein n=1 Tax=Planctomyces sp. SH-PL14 TaxID=1632864 RepID=UPI00078EE7DC|nr:hypothetical protein [Planctomyces sp. SH-PL14]AMV17115.1 hypothetical protein VT03_04440 [Planctomyces sp. SH-PL14]
MERSLDLKLAAIHADPSGARDFILADAKDADMAFGIGAPGLSPERHDQELKYKTLAEYRDQIRQVIRQGVVDIVLMSVSTSEQLTLREGLFENSSITPAIRANDATDVHVFRGSRIGAEPARPFRTALLDHAQCGHLDCAPEERPRGASLGLYSLTFNNDLKLDLATLEAYNDFRAEAERKGFRHFMEIFNPNVAGAVSDELRPQFINDVIARTLAGVATAGRPVFLKIAYQGPKAMEELVAYDPHLIVGVLGGAAGTTLDAFTLLHEAQKHGARAALFGRKINQAENQLAFIEFLRHIADGLIEPEEAVRAYHAVLEKLKIRPHWPLEEDLTLQTNVTSYAGSEKVTSVPKKPAGAASTAAGSTDLSKMTSEERAAYHRTRIQKMFGA